MHLLLILDLKWKYANNYFGKFLLKAYHLFEIKFPPQARYVSFSNCKVFCKTEVTQFLRFTKIKEKAF